MGEEEIRNHVESLINLTKSSPANRTPEKSGGFLTIYYGFSGSALTLSVGDYDSEKRGKYHNFSLEKAYRLYADWWRNPEAVSSWQTRQPDLNRYGGAVLFSPSPLSNNINIVSFSGLSEHADEAVSLALGRFYIPFPQTEGLVKAVVSASNNQIFRDISMKISQD